MAETKPSGNKGYTNRANAAEIEARVEVAYQLILKGWSTASIVQSLAQQAKLSIRQPHEMIRKARERGAVKGCAGSGTMRQERQRRAGARVERAG